jgi:phage-related protein
MEDTVSINGVDIKSVGFKLREPRGVWDLPSYAKDTTTIPGKPGQVAPESSTVKISSRMVDLVGTLVGSTRADFLSKLDQMKALITKTPLVVVLAEQPTRQYVARPLGAGMTPTGPVLLQRQQEFTITMVCDDPYARDTTDQVVAFGAATPIPLGTAPSGGVITITGGTNPTITYRDSAGNVVQTMGFTGTGSPLVIDLDQFLASVGGVNAIDKLTSGSFIELSPLDGDYATSAWPTLEVDSGTGSITYRRAYL